jgi:uncharacterized protein YwqG
MAIRIQTTPTTEDLTGHSHLWGFPDLPEGVAYPCYNDDTIDDEGFEDTLTFIGQIRLEEVAALDTEGLLPKQGMLYFFAALDYFLGDMEADCEGLGEWPSGSFKLLYAPDCSHLHTHKVFYEDGTPATLPTEAMAFSTIEERADGLKLLGRPFYEEQTDEPLLSLLQLDENEAWGLRFFDMGMLCFLIDRKDLAEGRFDRTRCSLHSL